MKLQNWFELVIDMVGFLQSGLNLSIILSSGVKKTPEINSLTCFRSNPSTAIILK